MVLEHGADECVVDGLVADGVGEDVDAVGNELTCIVERVDMRGDVEAILVGLLDGGGVDGGRHLG